MRLHDALGDRKPKAGALSAIGAALETDITADEFLEDMRQNVWRNARAVVGDPDQHALLFNDRIHNHPRIAWGVRHRVADDISENLFDQRGIRTNQWQIGGKIDIKSLGRTPAPRRTDHAFHDLTQVDPIPPQFKRTRVDPRNGKQIAHHAVEILDFTLD